MLLGTREPCVVDCCPNVVQSFSVFIHVQSPVFIRKHFHPPYVIHSIIHTHLRTLTKRKLTKIKCRETVWKDTSVAVFFPSIHAVTDISATVGIEFCMMVQDKSSPLFGAVPQIRNFGPKFWPFDRRYLENGASHC